MRMVVVIIVVLLVAAAAAAAVVVLSDEGGETAGTPATPGESPPEANGQGIETVARDLSVPWEVVFLPDGRLAVTERPGTLTIIADGGSGAATEIAVDGVQQSGEGGLLGMAPHPDFRENRYLYLCFTTQSGAGLTNRVERYRLEGDSLSDRRTIVDGVPGSSIHNGGRIRFGPDGFLYITTGDAAQAELAQDTDSLAGKILRVDENGDVPWAPSGMAIIDGTVYFAGLRGSSVYSAELADGSAGELRSHFTGRFGRLRTIVAHDGGLYITTNNTDGRGDPGGADDRILRLDPAVLD
jgi:glucose/arabinose dehydrogenase